MENSFKDKECVFLNSNNEYFNFCNEKLLKNCEENTHKLVPIMKQQNYTLQFNKDLIMPGPFNDIKLLKSSNNPDEPINFDSIKTLNLCDNNNTPIINNNDSINICDMGINGFDDNLFQVNNNNYSSHIQSNDNNFFQLNNNIDSFHIQRNDNNSFQLNNNIDSFKIHNYDSIPFQLNRENHSSRIQNNYEFPSHHSNFENEPKNNKKKHDKYTPDHIRNKQVNKCFKSIFNFIKALCLILCTKLQEVYITTQFRDSINKNYVFIHKTIKKIIYDSSPKKKGKISINKNQELIENILEQEKCGKYEEIRQILVFIFNSTFSDIYDLYINDATKINGVNIEDIQKLFNKLKSEHLKDAECLFKTFKDDNEKLDNNPMLKNKYVFHSKFLIEEITKKKLKMDKKRTKDNG